MASVDTPEADPPFDQLCANCTEAFDGTFDWQGSSLKSHGDIYSLAKAADQGYHVCTLILASIPSDVAESLRRALDSSRVDPCNQLFLSIDLQSRRLCIYDRSPPFSSDKDPVYWDIEGLAIQRVTQNSTSQHRIQSRSNYSTSTTPQILRWLDTCLGTHSECLAMQSVAATRKILPTRLLDLKDVVQHGLLRLITTRGLPHDTVYATLSHCWGGKCGLTLTGDKLATMEKGIGTACLPRTFRDAVSVAVDLNIRYLWIDALCIIQDSVNDEDWSHEASLMGDVYANSYITLAATTSPNSTQGLFHRRNPLAVYPCRVKATWNCFDPGDYVVGILLLVREQDHKPLGERAWAYQEWLLSKRLLHFSDDQVRWVCYCLSASEAYPNGLDEDELNIQTTQTKAVISALRNHPQYRHGIWERIREEYSSKLLTNCADRLAAFSGIARMAHMVLDSPPGDYLAGLW